MGGGNGHYIPETPIVVDYWTLKGVPPKCVRFLSHMHADHIHNLTKFFPYKIHCTCLTARMLQQKFDFSADKLVILEYNEPKTLYVESICGPQHQFIVTAFDAHHCPGAAMFLFEGEFGTILYTGDFRYETGENGCYEELSFMGCQKNIDLLYLDNTYCDPVCEYPPRHAVSEAVIATIKEFFTRSPQGHVYIGMDSLGKEDLAVRIARELKMWIGVDQERMDRLALLQFPNVFTTQLDQVMISIVSNNRICDRTIDLWSEEGECLVILPTSRYCGPGGVTYKFTSEKVAVFKYSDHSSYSELHRFVKAVCPKKIIPIVHFRGVSASRNNMDVFRSYLSTDSLNPHLDRTVPIFPNKSYLLDAPVHSAPRQHRKRPPTSRTNTGKPKRPKGVCYASPRKLTRHSSNSARAAKKGKLDFSEDRVIYVEPTNAWDVGSGSECRDTDFTLVSSSQTDTDDQEAYFTADDLSSMTARSTHPDTCGIATVCGDSSQNSTLTPTSTRTETLDFIPESPEKSTTVPTKLPDLNLDIPLHDAESDSEGTPKDSVLSHETSRPRRLPKTMLSLLNSGNLDSINDTTEGCHIERSGCHGNNCSNMNDNCNTGQSSNHGNVDEVTNSPNYSVMCQLLVMSPCEDDECTSEMLQSPLCRRSLHYSSTTPHKNSPTTPHKSFSTTPHKGFSTTLHKGFSTTPHRSPSTTPHKGPSSTPHKGPSTTPHKSPSTILDGGPCTLGETVLCKPTGSVDEKSVIQSIEDVQTILPCLQTLQIEGVPVQPVQTPVAPVQMQTQPVQAPVQMQTQPIQTPVTSVQTPIHSVQTPTQPVQTSTPLQHDKEVQTDSLDGDSYPPLKTTRNLRRTLSMFQREGDINGCTPIVKNMFNNLDNYLKNKKKTSIDEGPRP